MALARRAAPRYADVAHLAAVGLPAEVLASVRPFFGSLTHVGASASDAVELVGSPGGVYDLALRVATSGGPGVARLDVSLDGGATWPHLALLVPPSGQLAVPGTRTSVAAGLVVSVRGPLAAADTWRGDAASSVELALDAASDWLDSYLARRYTLPLAAWDSAVTGAAAAHAALAVLTARGFDPDVGADKAVLLASREASAWAELVAQGRVTPRVVDASPEPAAVDVAVASSPRRRFR